MRAFLILLLILAAPVSSQAQQPAVGKIKDLNIDEFVPPTGGGFARGEFLKQLGATAGSNGQYLDETLLTVTAQRSTSQALKDLLGTREGLNQWTYPTGSGVTLGGDKEPIAKTTLSPVKETFVASLGGGDTELILDALAARKLYRETLSAEYICSVALSALGIADKKCGVEQRSGQDVYVSARVLDERAKIYAIDVYGSSEKLALGNHNWREFHRFYVSFGFDAELRNYITFYNFDPRYHERKDLFPIQPNLLHYVMNEHDSQMIAFNDRIKSAFLSDLKLRWAAIRR